MPLFFGPIKGLDQKTGTNATMQPEYSEQSSGSRLLTGLSRGFRRKCPNCGHGLAFGGYLKLRQECDCCAHPIGEYRCDDAPPYFTIFIVGHIVVGGALTMEQSIQPSMALQLSVWLPITVLLCLGFLPFIKGAVLGTQWAMKIKG
ncbi:uncharacterized protein (DUF983 family) [Thalassospira sp. MBR-102]|jgi:uncharacterized protein (DUF983 family)|uniref:DUF983 domain-containing protein n=1 Tax=Thalassospira sp. MBR-102 TaxID=3156466 RepID=UPI00339747B7